MNGRKSFGGGGGGGGGRARRRRQRAQGKDGAAPSDVPPAQGLQVLRGQDRRHQLQGHASC